MPSNAVTTGGTMGPLVARGAFGGVLMGLANLVPGISGGTMLLAAGVFRAFITAIAEVTSFTFRTRSIVLLGSVIGAALLAFLLGAGLLKGLVLNHRWVMYSIFIGLTFGGVPMVWGLVKAADATRRVPTWIGAALGFAGLAVVALTAGSDGAQQSNALLFVIAGMCGAAAMVLPGVSGAYLLLVLGQYVPILASVDRVKEAIAVRDVSAVLAEWTVVVPVGVGVVVGLVGVSNLLKWMLRRFEPLTLGLLLGLLVGSVLGLYPFQEAVSPHVGDTFKGQVVTEASLPGVAADQQDWPLQAFRPSAMQVVASLGLMVLGFLITAGVARLGAVSPARNRHPSSGAA